MNLKIDKSPRDQKVKIVSDLFLPLSMYSIPAWLLKSLKSSYPFVEIRPLNDSDKAFLREATIYWGNIITKDLINQMPNLKWIHFGSVGVNRAHFKEVVDRKIIITNSRGTMVNAMVASALAFMTNLARGFNWCQSLRNKKNLTRESFDQYFDDVHDLVDESCLIVGYGDVGKKLSEICVALNMDVSVISKRKSRSKKIKRQFLLKDLENAVRDKDYVINLLPYNNETKDIFSKKIFKNMKKSSFFINIGRGETVVEDDLIFALNHKIISGAGLDVFNQEPLAKTSKLWNLNNTIITPHIAGMSSSYWKKQGSLFCSNLEYFFKDNKKMKNTVKMKLEHSL